jgi:hypothetical protein
MTTTRRTFVIQAVAGTSALAAACMAQAQSKDKVVDTGTVKADDATAVALAYNYDGSKTDVKKFPKYAKEQHCSTCALFQGKATDKAGACPLFAGKMVAATGWCSAYAKKA